MSLPEFSSEYTPEGEMPPWEVAKAFAFHVVLGDVAELLGMAPNDLVNGRVDTYIASKVWIKGGEHPTERCVQKVIARCKDPNWFPGKGRGAGAGRKATYSDHQKSEAARVGMDLKRQRINPTPRRVRQRLKNSLKNPETGTPMSDSTITRIFKTRCYDEAEDDPWIYLTCLSQDTLPTEMLPLRMNCAQHILDSTDERSWYSHLAIDPCYSLLAITQAMLEEQQIAAMGKKRWGSKQSARSEVNLRASATVKTQSSAHHSRRVDWTVVFARGKVLIYVVDTEAAATDPTLPAKLTDSKNLSKFVSNVLPGLLDQMKTKYGWHTIPRTVVHDKASYMVSPLHDRLVTGFAKALEDGGFRSWVGSSNDSACWLVRKLGDLYLHETVIAHIRRLLDGDFCHNKLFETTAHFKLRMQLIEDHLNSDDFTASGGRGLLGLAKDLRPRCQEIIARKGARLPK